MSFLRPLYILSFIVVLLAEGCSGGPAVQPPVSATEPAPSPVALPTNKSFPTDPPILPSTPVIVPTQSFVGQVKGYEVSGTVLSGGDTTPKGLMDAPRKFAYQIKTEDGKLATVTYTAYPPSPVGDKQKITLKLHGGGVEVGDTMKARGTFDENTMTLVVAEEGDFIETTAATP
jgi:hypothetical protein